MLSLNLLRKVSDALSSYYRSIRENYNAHYKNVGWSFYPNFFTDFELDDFSITPEKAADALQARDVINDSTEFIGKYLTYYNQMTEEIFEDRSVSKGDSIKETPRISENVYGLALDPFLRRRSPSTIKSINLACANRSWEEWQNEKITAVYNSIAEKGELGLSPTPPTGISYSIYETERIWTDKGHTFLQQGNEISLPLAAKMVRPENALMTGFQHARGLNATASSTQEKNPPPRPKAG